MKTVAFIFAFLVVTMRPAAGQTTQPSDPKASWSDCVARFAEALPAPGTDSEAHCTEDVAIRPLNRTSRITLDALRTYFVGGTLVSVHVYGASAPTFATDLAEKLQDVEMPLPLRKLMIPEEQDSKRANITASRWIESVLQPAEGEQIGVIVVRFGEGESFRLAFVLVKSREVTPQEYRIRAIAFGDPLTSD